MIVRTNVRVKKRLKSNTKLVYWEPRISSKMTFNWSTKLRVLQLLNTSSAQKASFGCPTIQTTSLSGVRLQFSYGLKAQFLGKVLSLIQVWLWRTKLRPATLEVDSKVSSSLVSIWVSTNSSSSKPWIMPWLVTRNGSKCLQRTWLKPLKKILSKHTWKDMNKIEHGSQTHNHNRYMDAYLNDRWSN